MTFGDCGAEDRIFCGSPGLSVVGHMATDACLECGHYIPNNGRVCLRCGAKVPMNAIGWWALVIVAILAVCAVPPLISEFLRPAPTDIGAPESDVGLGSKFAGDHPDLLPSVTAAIRAHGHR